MARRSKRAAARPPKRAAARPRRRPRPAAARSADRPPPVVNADPPREPETASTGIAGLLRELLGSTRLLEMAQPLAPVSALLACQLLEWHAMFLRGYQKVLAERVEDG